MDKRTVQDICFEPYPVSEAKIQNPDMLNLFSGLPYDTCLQLNSTVETRSCEPSGPSHGVDPVHDPVDPAGEGGIAVTDTIKPHEAAYLALQKPDAVFKKMPSGAVFILRHIEQQLCNGNVPSCLFLLRWLAFAYRYRKKSGVLVIIVGEMGCGKSSIFSSSPQMGLIARLWGKHFKEVGSVSALLAHFSDKQEFENMFVTIEEGDNKGNLPLLSTRMISGCEGC